MKNRINIILIGIMLSISIKSSAQSIDSLSQELRQMKHDFNEVKLNLDKCHQQFRQGLLITYAGSVLLTGGILMMTEGKAPSFGNYLVLGYGSLIVTYGSIKMIDSHKYIGRAGRVGFTTSGVTLDIN